MIDTNQIAQAGELVTAVKAQVQVNWPAIAFGAALVARELGKLNAWLFAAAEFAISHGGLICMAVKIFWNPGLPAHGAKGTQIQSIETAVGHEGK